MRCCQCLGCFCPRDIAGMPSFHTLADTGSSAGTGAGRGARAGGQAGKQAGMIAVRQAAPQSGPSVNRVRWKMKQSCYDMAPAAHSWHVCANRLHIGCLSATCFFQSMGRHARCAAHRARLARCKLCILRKVVCGAVRCGVEVAWLAAQGMPRKLSQSWQHSRALQQGHQLCWLTGTKGHALLQCMARQQYQHSITARRLPSPWVACRVAAARHLPSCCARQARRTAGQARAPGAGKKSGRQAVISEAHHSL